jgi:hypothetical protein
MHVYRLWNVQRVTFIISVTLRKVNDPVFTTNMDPGLFFWALMARHISTSEKRREFVKSISQAKYLVFKQSQPWKE